MPSDKAAYLAAHYLTVETKSSSSSTKKRKRKQTAASGLLITDDDETGWDASNHKKDDAEDDDTPVTIAGTTAEFRRAKKSGWKTVGDAPALSSAEKDTTTTTTTTSSSSAATTAKTKDVADAAAEEIIASAAAEKAAAAAAEEAEDLQVPVMSNGTLAGLQSASALTAQLRKRQELEAAELAELKAAAENQKKKKKKDKNKDGDDEPEVILRDATGRRVDVTFRRAEARRQAAEAERAEKAKQDLLRGEVQAAEARARRERLEDAALLPLARTRDDRELNEELKRAERWNDPMAEFMATTSSSSGGGGGTGGSGAAAAAARAIKKGRPVYKGPAPPNRYGIRPGYRWDGVDRSNGFEAERFKALNRREMQKGLEYSWQMDE
ncbi:hypothetical protein VTH82DRAFT_4307 [Thermothelomyces myriococcoides]